mmetsp:Transcript_98420/g.263071  ORF Transcript_98420/g.263071 Transcript_98420/m.263071 type:complete len:326 (+) Transcript_98420:4763-5740(+)
MPQSSPVHKLLHVEETKRVVGVRSQPRAAESGGIAQVQVFVRGGQEQGQRSDSVVKILSVRSPYLFVLVERVESNAHSGIIRIVPRERSQLSLGIKEHGLRAQRHVQPESQEAPNERALGHPLHGQRAIHDLHVHMGKHLVRGRTLGGDQQLAVGNQLKELRRGVRVGAWIVIVVIIIVVVAAVLRGGHDPLQLFLAPGTTADVAGDLSTDVLNHLIATAETLTGAMADNLVAIRILLALVLQLTQGLRRLVELPRQTDARDTIPRAGVVGHAVLNHTKRFCELGGRPIAEVTGLPKQVRENHSVNPLQVSTRHVVGIHAAQLLL